MSGLTDNLAAKQSPAVSCGDQRAVHFTPPCTCQAHMPPNMCLCVQETLPTWSPLSPPQLQINIALLHCKSQWNLECQYPSSQSQMSFSAHLRLIFLELQIIEAGWEGHHHQVECNVNKFKLLWRGPFHKPSLETGTLGHIMHAVIIGSIIFSVLAVDTLAV